MTQLILPEDGGHWYRPDGTPMHWVENKSKPGEYRASTMRDAKALGLLPSVTVILRVLHRPALQAYLINQHLLSAATLPRVEGETEDDFMRRVVIDARQHGEQAANFGTRIHSWMEWKLSRGQMPEPILNMGDYRIVAGLETWLGANPVQVDMLETNLASADLGYGGRLDCVGSIPSLGVPKSVIDWKTQEIGKRKGFNHYRENAFQGAAYARLLGEPLPVCVIYIARDVPGMIEVVQYEPHDGWSEFLACRVLWTSMVWERGDS